ncbi:hypothetical protein D3C76_1705520 [compost metagenome]
MLAPMARLLNANPASTSFLGFMNLILVQLIHMTTRIGYVVLSSPKAQNFNCSILILTVLRHPGRR